MVMPQKKINAALDLDTCPEFYKVFVPDCSSERLLIRPAFIKLCDAVLPQKTTLLNYTSKTSHLMLEKEDDKLFLKEGWHAFVRDNRLEFGVFLVFSFDGNSNFNIKAYGKTGCAKESVMAALECEQPSLHGHEEKHRTPRSRSMTYSNSRQRYTIHKECLIPSSVDMLKRWRKKHDIELSVFQHDVKLSAGGLKFKSEISEVSQMTHRERSRGIRPSYGRNSSKVIQELDLEAAGKYDPKYPSFTSQVM